MFRIFNRLRLLYGRLTKASIEGAEPEIELGAVGDDLRYWAAKEALRQVELRKRSQTDIFSSFNTRATSVLGWSVTGILALGAAVVTGHQTWAAAATILPLTCAAALSISVLWPRRWYDGAWAADWVLRWPRKSELETIEAMATGGHESLEEDDKKLQKFARRLAIAYGCLIGAPVLGLIVFLVTSPLSRSCQDEGVRSVPVAFHERCLRQSS